MRDLGDRILGSVVDFKFTTISGTGVPTALSGSPAVAVYKSNGTTETTTGVTLTVNFDTRTGLNHVRVDTSADGTFYAAGGEFDIIITAGTVDGESVAGYVIGHFTVEVRNDKVDVRKFGGTAGNFTAGRPEILLGNVAHTVASLTVSGAFAVQGGTTFSNASGNAFTCTSTGANGHGFIASGHGTGSGVRGQGGTASNGGSGFHGIGGNGSGTTAGDGMRLVQGTDGTGGTNGVALRVAAGGIVGSIAGDLSGSVGSVTAAVTVGTNNDKTGYALSTAQVTALVAAIEAEIADDATGAAVKQAIIDKLIENLPDLDDLTLAAIGNAARDAIRTYEPDEEAPGTVGARWLFLDASVQAAIDAADGAALQSQSAASSASAAHSAAVAVQAVTDKLDTTLEEPSPGVYRYTQAALEEAPTGGGDSVWSTTQRDAVLDAAGRINVIGANTIAHTGNASTFRADVSGLLTASTFTTWSGDWTTARATKIDNLDATVTSRAQAGDAMTLTVAERDAVATRVEFHLLDEGDSQMLINAIVGAIGNENIDEVALVAAIRADLERGGGMIEGIDSRVTTPRLAKLDVAGVLSTHTAADAATATAAAILVTPAQKLVTNETGQVEASNAGDIDLQPVIDLLNSGNVITRVGGYETGMAPETRLLVFSDRKITVDETGKVVSDAVVNIEDLDIDMGVLIAGVVLGLTTRSGALMTAPLNGGTLTLFRGDEYTVANSRAIVITRRPSDVSWPATLDSVHFYLEPTPDTLERAGDGEAGSLGPIACEVLVGSGSEQSFRLEITSTQTLLLAAPDGRLGNYRYRFRANQATAPATLLDGAATVRDTPALP